MKKLETISKEYLEQNVQLHKKGFGGGGYKNLPVLLPILKGYQVESLLDYGAGQRTLTAQLKNLILEGEIHDFFLEDYDPAIPDISEYPEGQFHIVTCTDVLEHIEAEYIDNVLQNIFNLSHQLAFLVIHCLPANKILPDGRNAHISQHQPEWWEAKLAQYEWTIKDKALRGDKETGLIKKVTYLMEK